MAALEQALARLRQATELALGYAPVTVNRAEAHEILAEVERLQRQLEEATYFAVERKKLTTALIPRLREAEATAVDLWRALEAIAKSYPNIRFEDDETITEFRPAPTDTGIPTNRRIARETLAAFAGSVPAINYDGPDESVECAYPGCTNRLRRSVFNEPQFCSRDHRDLAVPATGTDGDADGTLPGNVYPGKATQYPEPQGPASAAGSTAEGTE